MADETSARTRTRIAETWRGWGVLGLMGPLVRLTMIIPILATSIASIALILYGAAMTVRFVADLWPGHDMPLDHALLLAIEIVDLFLLATVVQVVALGLYQLYFNQDFALPHWLKISTLDDLKSKLVGVVVTVLAVHFLGQALAWEGDRGIAFLGGGVALVIGALTWFLRQIDEKH